MYVKMLDGREAGKIVDLRNDVALEFLRLGRADHAYRDPAPEAPQVRAIAMPPQANPAKKRKAR